MKKLLLFMCTVVMAANVFASHYREFVARSGDYQPAAGEPVTVYFEQWQNPGCPYELAPHIVFGIDGVWDVQPMTGDRDCDPYGNGGHSQYTYTIPGQPEGTIVEYVVYLAANGDNRWRKAGDNTAYNVWDVGYTRYGEYQNFSYTVGPGAPALAWVGNTYNWPVNGELDQGEDLWINVDTWPMDSAAYVGVVYTVDEGASWLYEALSLGTPEGNNDHWYANLGSYGSGVHIQYAIVAEDLYGSVFWDSNDGSDFHAHVN